MSSPAPALIPAPRVSGLEFCQAALRARGLQRTITPDQMKAALGGIANVYGLHALSAGADEFSVETEGGFVSNIVSREVALQEISNCTGVADKAVVARMLEAFEQTLDARLSGAAKRAIEIPGLGTFVRDGADSAKIILHFAFP